MRKMIWTAISMGAAYLLRNKEARQKLMTQFQSFRQSKQR
ncbi:hypothetical protein ACVLD2_000278 [Paenibacillus sp. PvR052]|nr:hypothetical protein [Paenibacillus sp. PvP091]MBP1168812.1 hypothetical protein [Paenibacillus sp. PvR098]MBP2439840.1 hypothetical protein [Paenibacillus sp. PvP052]